VNKLLEILEQESLVLWRNLDVCTDHAHKKKNRSNIFLLKKSSTCENVSVVINHDFNEIFFSYARGFLELLKQENHVLWTNLEICACQPQEKKKFDSG
jgi:hypothetical protein